MVSAFLVILLIATVVLVFLNLVFGAMAANDVKKSSCANTDAFAKSAHKYAMISAIISGVGVFMVIAAVLVYVFSSRHELAAQTGSYISSFGKPTMASV
ncbi:hypothetical protein ISTM_143 [Insectomime virus]|uniref:Uncharacterized protein n=1 Tax=Tunisvirus fontaine2 TaxID=1421067 RepID=V9SDT9_9VIRU|nr:hypothetical protein D1R32_gp178 [Tunisvirus fontaine2]AHA46041.1 hypothetical protein ISTM_143 [Insectomime virus]AHC54895.1 hypothetical protein TNS_ORF177 [Tunisvirus fontaine2]